MKFRLVEEILTENAKDYREMFLELLRSLSSNKQFNELLASGKPLHIHHIVPYTTHTGSKDNTPLNLSIMSNSAHTAITNMNNAVYRRKDLDDNRKRAEISNNFNRIAENPKYKDEVFDLYKCLPHEVVDIIVQSELSML